MPKGLLIATCLWTLLLPALCCGGLVAHACTDGGHGICAHEDDCDHDPCAADFLRPAGPPGGAGSAQAAAIAICPPAPIAPAEIGPAACGPLGALPRVPGLATHESDLPLLN